MTKQAAALSFLSMYSNLNTYFYRAFGMNIRSEMPLPDLVTAASGSDIAVRYGEVRNSELVRKMFADAEIFERPGVRLLVKGGSMCIRWDGVGDFLVNEGREVTVHPDVDVSEADLHPFVTGPVISVLLHQRGYFVLHASAVVISDAAVAFLGAKGDGKSTLAAHLQVRGHRLISDDIVPVRFESGGPNVLAGFPRIKLFGDSISAVGECPDNFPRVHRFVEKRSFNVSNDFSSEPIPLQRIYVLSDAPDVGSEELGPAAAFIELTRHTYVNKYLKALGSESDHFQQCQSLLQDVPVWQLRRPRDFAAMEEVCELIESSMLGDRS